MGTTQGLGGTIADFFKGVSSVILLNISFFTTSKVFSIYGLSSLFIGS
jgi:hypothetical protein